MSTCGLDCDADTDRSVPMVTNLDTAAIARQSKSADEIIRSATFPAAHAPSPDDSSRSEGDRWPYSLAVLGTVGSPPMGMFALATSCRCTVHTSPQFNSLLFFPPPFQLPPQKALTASLLYSRLTLPLGRFKYFAFSVLLAQSRSCRLVSAAATALFFPLEVASVSPFLRSLTTMTGALSCVQSCHK